MLERFGDADDPELQEWIALGLSCAGVALTDVSKIEHKDWCSARPRTTACATRSRSLRTASRGGRAVSGSRDDPAESAQPTVRARRRIPRAGRRGVGGDSPGDSPGSALQAAQVGCAGAGVPGVTLDARLLRRGDAIAGVNDLLDGSAARTEPPLREQIAKAMIGKGDALVNLQRTDEALAVYGEAFALFGGAGMSGYRSWPAGAGTERGAAVRPRTHRRRADRAGREHRPPPSGERRALAPRWCAVRARRRRRLAHGTGPERQRPWPCSTTCCAASQDTTEAELKFPIACAVGGKSAQLERLGRSEEAVSGLIMDWPTDSTDPRLRFILAYVRSFKGGVLSESLAPPCRGERRLPRTSLARFKSTTRTRRSRASSPTRATSSADEVFSQPPLEERPLGRIVGQLERTYIGRTGRVRMAAPPPHVCERRVERHVVDGTRIRRGRASSGSARFRSLGVGHRERAVDLDDRRGMGRAGGG